MQGWHYSYTKKSDKEETAWKNTLEDKYLKIFGVLE